MSLTMPSSSEHSPSLEEILESDDPSLFEIETHACDAQAALVAGGLDLSLISVLLAYAGTAWRPGARRLRKVVADDQITGRSVADDNGGRRRRAVPVVI